LKAGYEEHTKTTKVAQLLDMDGFKLMGEKELRKQMQSLKKTMLRILLKPTKTNQPNMNRTVKTAAKLV
jgi:hypothetical protein